MALATVWAGIKHERNRALLPALCIMLIVLAYSAPVTAQTQDEQWHFIEAPYLMGASMSGDVTVLGRQATVDLSAHDILSNLRFGFMNYFEAKKGDWGFGVDMIYAQMRVPTVNPPADVYPTQAFFTFFATRRLSETLDVQFGAKWNIIKNKIELKTQNPLVVEKTKQWVDPMVGLRWAVPFSGEMWRVGVAMNMSGFGINSHFGLDGLANIQYRMSKSAWLGFGYRIVYTHYEFSMDDPPMPDAFQYNVLMQGPELGVVFRY